MAAGVVGVVRVLASVELIKLGAVEAAAAEMEEEAVVATFN